MTSTRTVAVARIHIPDNVRGLDEEHVAALAGSIKLKGMLVPVVLRERDDDFELVAGFHRMAAAESIKLAEVPYVLRDAETEHTDRAVENIVRKQLNPYEEAKSVRAMLDGGLTEDGAAQALGWPKARVTARVKLLELPERAQQMVGEGIVHLAAVDQLRAIGAVAPQLLDALIAYLDDGNAAVAERLASQPGWVLDAALTHAGDRKVFAAHLSTVDRREIAELRLGKKTDELYAEAEKLHKQLDRHAYGPPTVRFEDEDVDQARAAGVLIEFERGRPLIVDRALYRELVKTAIRRTHATLEQKVADRAAERSASKATDKPVDPAAVAKRDRDAQMQELADQAHGVNLDLGRALIDKLASVDPADMDVARFFVYALLGSDPDGSPYTQSGDRITRVAAGGVRLLIEELRTDVTKTRKDGSRGRLRYDYGDHRDPQAAIAWLWKFIDGAKTAADLYGRALVVIAAEQHASRLVVNGSQRAPATRWTSHKDHAAKALRKLCRPAIPATMARLERAVARANTDYEQALTRAREQAAPDET
ncbi:MAG TPA: ParB/RepB/Spo0J family partition protein [Baekduia sp.]|uniref:ParB/RepB/Spo0J family partition protein n=1 Tax=Baekduia sp. TaxID=2600305 RepID=UPI002D76FD37|nr:ParB/RepB/Spo0J family partition protein [Baekduia sp.]HET6507380.1 ParB/RepB/Spo0J family partition protein [Baekduia sp.]